MANDDTSRCLKGCRVGSIMDPSPVIVRPDVTISELVHDSVLRRRVRAVPAVANGEFIGIITLTDVKAVPADRGIVSGA